MVNKDLKYFHKRYDYPNVLKYAGDRLLTVLAKVSLLHTVLGASMLIKKQSHQSHNCGCDTLLLRAPPDTANPP